MDIVGPLPSGDDVGWAPGNGIPPKVKYMMVATVALPKLEREKGDQKDPAVEMDEAPEGDLFSRQAEAGEGEAEENQGGDQKAAEELNQKWLEHAKRLSEPVGVQNLTMVEPLASRHQSDVARVAARLYSRYRALGVGVFEDPHGSRNSLFIPTLPSLVSTHWGMANPYWRGRRPQ